MELRVYEIDKEFSRVAMNKDLLDRLAHTGGTSQSRDVEGFAGIMQELRSGYSTRSLKESQIREFRTFDHRIFLLLLFIAAVAGEWILRYRWGLR